MPLWKQSGPGLSGRPGPRAGGGGGGGEGRGESLFLCITAC